MDEQLQDKLNSILSDPEQMSGIFSVAQQLMGGTAGETDEPKPEQTAPLSGGLLSMLGGALGASEDQSRNQALLSAMSAYLRPERREKMQRAMKLSRMMSLAGRVMKEYGGEALGL